MEVPGIEFRRVKSNSYKDRTIENAKADITLAFAIDFNTFGEILTKKSVESNGKIYIPIPILLNGIIALRDECQRQIDNQIKCPHFVKTN